MSDYIHCPFGLGNRVAAMANGLSRQPSIRFTWPVNWHCPATAAEVFPNGVAGVEFLPGPRHAEFATRWAGRMAHDWDSAADREAANAAFVEIMGSMVGSAMWDAPKVAILGRFHRNPDGAPERLADAVISELGTGIGERVFLLSDLHRPCLSDRLTSAGIQVVQPSCRPLADDLRRSREDVLDYACDWATMLAARLIIALDGPASALHPARARGLEIRYV